MRVCQMQAPEGRLGTSWIEYERLSLPALVRADAGAHGGLLDSLLSPGFWVVLSYRVAHALSREHVDLAARVIQALASLFLHCEISRKAVIGPRLQIFHPSNIFIGPYCRIGQSFVIGPGAFVGSSGEWSNEADYPVIGDGVTVGPGAKILGPITIGHECRIGPNAVVMQNVLPRTAVMARAFRIVRSGRWTSRQGRPERTQ